MPIEVLASTEAVENRKTNPMAGWSSRNSANRVEPVCLPDFKVPFLFEKGEPIFTVGSCFARNVEAELIAKGFELPMRNALKDPSLEHLEASTVNNYGAPSIRNEFAWAFGTKDFNIEDHAVEVGAGKWTDLHLPAKIRPDSLEAVRARREAIRKAYASVRQCRVVIITLGYVELWYDTLTKTYLNATPRPVVLREHPKRFKLHVLSFEETWRYLSEALDLLATNGHQDLKVVLTVSPVPLGLTHRDDDVIVANSYSKAVLRAAAETAKCKYPFVTYFPSYESITYSDRKIAWRDDQVHVTNEIVAINVERMVKAFTGADDTTSDVFDAISRAQVILAGESDTADRFLAESLEKYGTNPDFAAVAIDHYINKRRFQEALDILSNLSRENASHDRFRLARVRALIGSGEFEEAIPLLYQYLKEGKESRKMTRHLLTAGLRSSNDDAKEFALSRIQEKFPRDIVLARSEIGRWYLSSGQLKKARIEFEKAIEADPTSAAAYLGLSETFLRLGKKGKARDNLAKARPGRLTDITRAAKLKKKIESRLKIKT